MRTFAGSFNLLIGAAALVLGGCGSDDDGGPATVEGPTLAITAANYETVAHATAAGMVGLSPTGMMVPLSAQAPGASALMSPWARSLSRPTARILSATSHRLSVYGPEQAPCSISGTVTETFDDRDNNGDLSIGDVITLVFDHCQDVAGELSTGALTMTLTQASASPVPSGSVQLQMSQMSFVTPKHAMMISGSMLFDYAQTSASLETSRATASGALTVAVTTHAGVSDTVTLLDGFVVDETYDNTVGLTVSTSSGLLQSQAAGGVVRITPVAGAPLRTYDTDAYPRSGAVQVTGMSGLMLMSVLSADAVQLNLDADGNGTYESSSVMAWDTLL